MIGLQTPTGKVNVTLRGIRTPAGNVDIARASILTPTGSLTFFDASAVGGTAPVANPTSVSGAQSTSGSAPINTNATTVTATGGTGPYTYAWALDNADLGNWTINAPTSQTTSFSVSTVPANEVATASFICTVTDARGRTGQVSVIALATNFGDPRGYGQIAP